MAATVQPINFKGASVLQLHANETRSLSLLAINSIQSLERYQVKRTDKKTYKSGAWYVGKFNGTQRIGWGQFNWSNGGCYDGNHVDNKRKGEGKYTWSDGSTYVGNFYNDLRHGFGELNWITGECYTGQFYGDMKHGTGTYTWSDDASYFGHFKNNTKCGFGLLSLPSGDIFEGIYKDDQRCGAGIYTYKQDGCQDVGLWKGNMLTRLCSVVQGTCLCEYLSDHYINSADNVSQYIKSSNQNITSKPNIPDEKANGASKYVLTVPSHFPYKSIMEGIRDVTTNKGRLELMSEEFLYAASVGDLLKIKNIVESGLVNVNVSDKTGFFALLAASINCHIKIINYLLDNGANINQITDEGLTCLSACHILLYAEQNYVVNTAENISRENIFNAVELDKKGGTIINRNERKMILSIYEMIYKPYGEKNSKSEPNETSQSRRKSSRDASSDSSRRNSIEYDDRIGKFDPWKLDYYYRSLDRVKEIDEINGTFKDIMLNPHKINDKNIEYIDLCSQGNQTEGWSNNSEKKYDTNFVESSKIVPTSAASVLGYNEELNTAIGRKTGKSSITKENINHLMNSERRPHLKNTIEVLLSRGGDPSISFLPMPVLFFAVKSAEPAAVSELLRCDADTAARLNHLKLCPLHIAVALPCNEGILITELLLKHGADPNARDGFLENDVELGRTPLHIVCSREDDYKQVRSIVSLLLFYGANPDLLCFGNAPLSLAIASGNDLVIDTLIKYNANVSLKLSHGLGSILCVAVSFQAERLRAPTKRLELVEKLIKANADMLTPVNISNKLPPATVMDYAYHVYYQDRRISCTPYHALSSLERECYNARKELLDRLASYFRDAVSTKEKELDELFLYSEQMIAKSTEKNGSKPHKKLRDFNLERDDDCGLGYVTVKRNKVSTAGSRRLSTTGPVPLGPLYKKRYRYCNECGRSVGVRLAPCPRCKEIFYCSKNCKIKLWNSRHREECAKTTGIKSPTLDLNNISADDTKTSKKDLIIINKVQSRAKVNTLGFLPQI